MGNVEAQVELSYYQDLEERLTIVEAKVDAILAKLAQAEQAAQEMQNNPIVKMAMKKLGM